MIGVNWLEIDMQKATQKRVNKLMEDMDTKARILATLEAIKDDDGDLFETLKATAPRKTYSDIDAAETDTIEACEAMALHFDRAFFMTLAERNKLEWWIADLAPAIPERGKGQRNETEEKIEAVLNRRSVELASMIAAIKTVADMVEIPLETMLCYSAAIHTGDFRQFDKPDRADPETVAEIVAALADRWNTHRFSAFQIDKD
ncbi:hypothetical protein [Hwanghaeella sp.]|uniref:hypothetical protein n=1 Tax=Hwanghaeella sp. TaxID=2605943 RepID=UPI003CCBAADF